MQADLPVAVPWEATHNAHGDLVVISVKTAPKVAANLVSSTTKACALYSPKIITDSDTQSSTSLFPSLCRGFCKFVLPTEVPKNPENAALWHDRPVLEDSRSLSANQGQLVRKEMAIGIDSSPPCAGLSKCFLDPTLTGAAGPSISARARSRTA